MNLNHFRQNNGLARWERWTEWPLLVAGLLFLVVIMLPLATPLPPQTQMVLDWINWFLWGASSNALRSSPFS